MDALDRTLLLARLLKRADRDPMIPGGCWLWNGGRANRYAGTTFKGTHITAHRGLYELLREPIPPGMEADHLCRVPCCVNPAHIEIVTHIENVRRGARCRPGGPKRKAYKPVNPALSMKKMFRVSDADLEALDYVAGLRGMTGSAWIRWAIHRADRKAKRRAQRLARAQPQEPA